VLRRGQSRVLIKLRGNDVYAKRAKADGQYAHRQTEQYGRGAAAGLRRPSGSLPMGPVSAGHAEAFQQSAPQVFWGKHKPPDKERLGLIRRTWGRLAAKRGDRSPPRPQVSGARRELRASRLATLPAAQ
jgi:hypothetical protein